MLDTQEEPDIKDQDTLNNEVVEDDIEVEESFENDEHEKTPVNEDIVIPETVATLLVQPTDTKSKDGEQEDEEEEEEETGQDHMDLEAAESSRASMTDAQIRDHIDKAFRAAFFGIVSNDEANNSRDDGEDEDGDVTPTEELENKKLAASDVVEEKVTDETNINVNEKQEDEEEHVANESNDTEEDDKLMDNASKRASSISSNTVTCDDEANEDEEDEDESSTEEVGTDTETLDVSIDMADGQSGQPESGKESPIGEPELDSDRYNELMYKAIGTSWEDVDVEDTGLPPPLLLHAKISSLKLDLLSSIFQGLYPTEQDCFLIRAFMSCPASLEEKYTMMRLSDVLKKNKRAGIELEDIAEAMSQLAKIGTELLRPEEERDPLWRSIPVAKEIMVTKGIADRAPWENIQVCHCQA